MEQLEEFARLMLDAVLPVVAAVAIAYLAALLKEHRSKITDERLRAFIDKFVEAAEQIYGAGQGAAKYDFVIRQIEREGLSAGRTDVEAAVHNLARWEGVFPT